MRVSAAGAAADVGLPLHISESARDGAPLRRGHRRAAQQRRDAHTAPTLDISTHKLRDIHATAACAAYAAGVLGSRYTSRHTAAPTKAGLRCTRAHGTSQSGARCGHAPASGARAAAAGGAPTANTGMCANARGVRARQMKEALRLRHSSSDTHAHRKSGQW